MLQSFSDPPRALVFLSKVISLPNAALERKSTDEKLSTNFLRFSPSTS